MNLAMPSYLLAVVAAASFAVGIVASPALLASMQPFNTAEKSDVEKFGSEIGVEIQKLSDEIQELKNKADEIKPEVEKSLADFEKQMKIIDMRIDRLNDLSDEIDELKKEIERLRTTQSQLLSASLDKTEYRAGDSLTVSGVGLANKLVRISLLDAKRITINDGSTTANSAGEFAFTIRLSTSLSDGNYIIRASQEDNVVEKQFRIVSRIAQTEGLTLTTNNSEYLRGETVVISGATDPNTWIDLDLFDSNDVQLVRTSTLSDANGKYTLRYTIASNAPPGQYDVKATLGDKQVTTSFFVVTTKSSTSTSNLTIQTDRTIYNRGDFVTVTGKAEANEKVTIFAKPPNGDTLVLTVNADSSGNYKTMFSINQDASTGQWELTAKQSVHSATTTISVI